MVVLPTINLHCETSKKSKDIINEGLLKNKNQLDATYYFIVPVTGYSKKYNKIISGI